MIGRMPRAKSAEGGQAMRTTITVVLQYAGLIMLLASLVLGSVDIWDILCGKDRSPSDPQRRF